MDEPLFPELSSVPAPSSDPAESVRSRLEKTLPLGRGVKFLAAHTCGFFAFVLAFGILSLAYAAGLNAARGAILVADYSLKNESYSCRVQGGGICRVFVLNRLDSPTSGVVLASTDECLAASARRAFAEGRVRKIYHALVRGVPVPAQGEWTDFLLRGRGKDGALRVRCVAPHRWNGAPPRNALFAATQFEVEQAGTPGVFSKNASASKNPLACSRVRLEPKTGRTHQLRVQCASRNFPILGDKTYGDFSLNARLAENGAPRRLFLHCGRTEIAFQWRGEKVVFLASSPLPQEFFSLFSREA